MNRGARMIRGVSPRDRITPVLIGLHWLPIKAMIIFKLCWLTYQALQNEKPSYLRDKLTVLRPSDRIDTRRRIQGYLEEPRCASNEGLRGFSAAAPRLYNKLPMEVKSAENMKIFKKRLKTFLFSECYCMDSQSIVPEYDCR